MTLGAGKSKSGGYSVVNATGQVLKPGSGAILAGGRTCPDGSYPRTGEAWVRAGKQECPPAPAAAGGASGVSMPNAPAAPAWQPSNLQRPDLTPIDPQAAYDPEIASQLARQRSFTGDLKAGTGFAADVHNQQQRDTNEAQMREAEQAAAQAGIPFDKARFLMEQQRGDAAGRAALTLGRESLVGQSIGAESGVAQGQAQERDTRLGIDLERDTTENTLALDRYGKDISKYGVDAQAATAANGALMDFYSRLASGAFSAVGSFGASGGNFSQSNVYGGY